MRDVSYRIENMLKTKKFLFSRDLLLPYKVFTQSNFQ